MYNQSKHKERTHFCMYCLQCSSSESILAKHTSNCLTISGKQVIKMPKKRGNILKFNNFHKQQPVPFVIYANFEAITKKVHGCTPNKKKSYTDAYQTHEDCSYAYKLVCCYDDNYTKPAQVFRGENAVYKFMEKMLYQVTYSLGMTDDDELCFNWV